jgi:hypothetical protein
MQLPDQLPRELIPSSRQDLGDTVDRVKELLERESRTHSPSSTDSPMSNLKNRSFYGAAPSFESNRDATIYKHTDEESPVCTNPSGDMSIVMLSVRGMTKITHQPIYKISNARLLIQQNVR